MDSNYEILDAIENLECKVDTLTSSYISCTTDILEALKINTEAIAALGEIMALAASPNVDDLERSQMLREAYGRYDFVRKLALGKEK